MMRHHLTIMKKSSDIRFFAMVGRNGKIHLDFRTFVDEGYVELI